jgi:putative ABC transport system permease protein
MATLIVAWKLARRQLRSGLSGFRVLFLCLALGVAAIAGVQSLSSAFLTGFAEQGRVLLGGDVAVGLVHRPISTSERKFLAHYGRVAESVSMRAMAYALRQDGHEEERELVELRAVDASYPLYGKIGLAPGSDLSRALACGSKLCGAAAEQPLLDRLRLATGGILRLGGQNFRVAAVLRSEPDRISGGFSLGPHILISTRALPRTGLVQLGSLINYSYRIAFSRNDTTAGFRSAAAAAFPDAGWEIRTRENAAPGILSFVQQVTMFLTLLGVATLAIGGVGAAQAIAAFLDRKRDEIATLKSLGADGAIIFFTFFTQVMVIACTAVIAGLALGCAFPFLVEWLYAKALPVPAHFALYPKPLGLAAMFGVLSAIAFAVVPLSRARAISPGALFRDIVAPDPARAAVVHLALSATAGAAVVLVALFLASSPLFAAEFLGGVLAVLAVLRAAAGLFSAVLIRLPRPRRPVWRLVLSNLTRPGATTASVVTALGLGLSLLATVTLLDRSISTQVRDALPQSAPTFFFVDIQTDEAVRFDAAIARFASARDYRRTPTIRGRIVALNGVPAKDAKVASDAKWALAGDRGITYSALMPDDTEITNGRWWPADYSGPTLVSFDASLARGLGLKIGDTITLNVLGREIEGRIANLRRVNFRNGRQNFILVLSPGVIDKAPHSYLATVRVKLSDEEAVYRSITDGFPNVSTVRVKDAIAQANGLLQQLAFGVESASAVTILSGLLVLGGAVAAGGRARLYDATILKVLGATRARILWVYAMEYALLGLLTGTLAFGAGAVVAWSAARWLIDVPFVLDARAAATTIAGGSAATLAFGLAAAWAALSSRPARRLREP